MKMNATSKNIIPSVKIEIKLNPYQKSSDCNAVAIPPFKTLKNIPFASSGVSDNTDVSMYWIRLYPIPSKIPTIKINIKTGIR